MENKSSKNIKNESKSLNLTPRAKFLSSALALSFLWGVANHSVSAENRDDVLKRHSGPKEVCIVDLPESMIGLNDDADKYFDTDSTIRGAADKMGKVVDNDPLGRYGVCLNTETGERRVVPPSNIDKKVIVDRQNLYTDID